MRINEPPRPCGGAHLDFRLNLAKYSAVQPMKHDKSTRDPSEKTSSFAASLSLLRTRRFGTFCFASLL